MNIFKCIICGRYMAMGKGYYKWTPYGNSLMEEPPDEEYVHISCYENLPQKSKNLIIKTSWRKPYKVKG